MACRNYFRFGNRLLQDSKGAENVGKAAGPSTVSYSRKAVLSSSHIQLLEEFAAFCEAKNVNLQNDRAQGGNDSFLDHGVAAADSSFFREDIKMNFGDQLPANVVDDLWKLVIDSTRGKCWSCKLPAENLVLGVLHILSSAVQLKNELKENIAVPPADEPNDSVMCGEEQPVHCSQPRGSHSASKLPEPTRCTMIGPVDQYAPEMHCAPRQTMHVAEGSHHSVEHSRKPNLKSTFARTNGPTSAPCIFSVPSQNSKEATNFIHCSQLNKQILETPLVMCPAKRFLHDPASTLAVPNKREQRLILVGITVLMEAIR